MKILVKGKRTHLTYQVQIYEFYGSWRCCVREPVLRPALLWGLIPARIKYVNPFCPRQKAESWAPNLTPSDIKMLGDLAVTVYEDWKLSWENSNVREA